MRSIPHLLKAAAAAEPSMTQALPALTTQLTCRQLTSAPQNEARCVARWHSTAATDRSDGQPAHPDPPAHATKEVLYRGRGIQVFRLLVRFKVAQLTGVAALAVPITTFLSSGELNPMQAVIAASLLIGSGVASTALWYYSRRYVGELSLVHPSVRPGTGADAGAPPHVRLSVLDFWGNREDVDVALEDLMPPLSGLLPAAARAVAAQPMLPITASGDRQYVLSVRYGHIVDAEKLRAVLDGSIASKHT